jgi:non-haem Fe2+, alpha-ketoglutarate-dependent halogenase
VNDDYQKHGFIARTRLISTPHANEARGELEGFIRDYGDHPQFADWCYFKSHMILPWVAGLAMAPGVVEVVREALGPDILLWNSFIPFKAPNSQGHFAWHQDATYWHLTPVEKMVTVWLALSDVYPENGSMGFLPGSHHSGQLAHEMTKDPKSMLRRGQRVTETIDDSTAIWCTLEPGEASLHHPFTLHGSVGNTSGQWRLAVALNYVSADVCPKPGYTESALYIAGDDRNQSFERDPLPAEALSHGALKALDHATALATARYRDVEE